MSAGKTILITGASGGLGQAMARKLASDGFDLLLHYRSNHAAAEQLAVEVRAQGREARLLAFDVTDRAAVRAALDAAVAAFGAPYGIVVNAGITRDMAFPAMEDGDWDEVLRTNLDGFYNIVHPLTMPMVRRRKPGRIVAISSVSGLVGNRGQVNYSAAKAGLIGACKALALELASRQITVNCVAPGLIETDMTENLPGLDELKKLIPMQRAGTAAEVAAAVSYLMSDGAAYTTRQVLSVNGGLC
ncbi:3-oxoacyl-ACP reductase FabG [Chitinilyticum piscinae]|uniref:3-oxoacyl-ACP reductase FabG n=1 Tax=Chitinilyticum piscinae TaxID=2866724 RepID=A0A8J7K7C1_9NEIS|nr:3-oxoacyl-ACP reductase FabG [Chitinilyticum piscinae]MBE9607813.1 3-oxoacyl-ACP reductase FabG [Chitinilyticum piscinae]